MTQTTTYCGSAVGPKPTNHAVGSLPLVVSAVPVLPASPPGKLRPRNVPYAVPWGFALWTTPVNPANRAWWVDADMVTWPTTWGANFVMTLPVGDTTAAATWGAYRVPPLAKVL